MRLYVDPEEIGRDGYPLDWPTIKDAVREGAGHRCVRCGHPYRTGRHGKGEWSPCGELCRHRGPIRMWSEFGIGPYDPDETNPGGLEGDAGDLVAGGYNAEAQWRILTVHHLNRIKADCRWFNLAALCQRCHLSIQSRVVMAQVYPFEHSDWFKPYAAGFYAAEYLGEELTRGEVEARLDELLALELGVLPLIVLDKK